VSDKGVMADVDDDLTEQRFEDQHKEQSEKQILFFLNLLKLTNFGEI
jgi:hypothetical protein